jgi:hypothetical protein
LSAVSGSRWHHRAGNEKNRMKDKFFAISLVAGGYINTSSYFLIMSIALYKGPIVSHH